MKIKNNKFLDNTLNFQNNYNGHACVPKQQTFLEWLQHAQKYFAKKSTINLCIIDQTESMRLNTSFRMKTGATNVLSFLTTENNNSISGEIYICADIVYNEAKLQKININYHWAHLFIHGYLHLLGFDHIHEKDAIIMEAKEKKILDSININPSQEDKT